MHKSWCGARAANGQVINCDGPAIGTNTQALKESSGEVEAPIKINFQFMSFADPFLAARATRNVRLNR